MANYPESLDDLTANVDDLGVLATASWKTPRAVEAVQAELGVTPSAAYATVAARLTAIEEAVVAPPAVPDEITGDTAADPGSALTLALAALDGLGLVTDSTTSEGTAPWLVIPTTPDEITGARDTGSVEILAALLAALDDLGIIIDSTTATTE